MSISQKVKRYNELKKDLQEYGKKPIGDRIKQGGLLEQRIKEKFNKETSEKVLTRSEGFNNTDFDKWNKTRREYETLCEELEEIGVLIYDDEGDECIECVR